MKKNLKQLLLLHIFSFLLLSSLSAQLLTGTEDEILIWNGPGPGSENLDIEQSITDRDINGECTANRAIENVTETGIVPFIPENPSGAAVLICPGGGYGRVVIDKEGSDIALWLNEMGIAAFVVKYRLPSSNHENNHLVTLQDAQRAMRYVRGNADHWGIDTTKIGIMGASAGGHMASILATLYDMETYTAIDSLDSHSAKPDFMILLYPVVSMETGVTHDFTRTMLLGSSPDPDLVELLSPERHVNADSPITFMARAQDDTSVPAANCTRLRDSLDKVGVSNELHIYADGGHGRGKCEAVGTDFYNWIYDCASWLKDNEFTSEGLVKALAPTGLVVTELTDEKVRFTWTVNEPEVRGHSIFLNGNQRFVTQLDTAVLQRLDPETTYTIGVASINLLGNSDTLTTEITTLEAVSVKNYLETEQWLRPNPVASVDQLVFDLPEAEDYVRITLYSMDGRVLDSRELRHTGKGSYTFNFDIEEEYARMLIVEMNNGVDSGSKLVKVDPSLR